VYLKDRQLWLGDAPYVPISVNYIFDIRRDPADDYSIATRDRHRPGLPPRQQELRAVLLVYGPMTTPTPQRRSGTP